MQSEKRSIKEYRILIAAVLFMATTIYGVVNSMSNQDQLQNDMQLIAADQPEISSLVYIDVKTTEVFLDIAIEGIDKSADDYQVQKAKYVNLSKHYICISEVLKSELMARKIIYVDLLTNKFPSSQFASFKVTLRQCS